MSRHLALSNFQMVRPVIFACLVFSLEPIEAQTRADYLEFNQSPQGQVSQPPLSLKSNNIGENTEQHLPPDAVFNLWTQDETFFRPHEEDRIEIKEVLEKQSKTFKLDNAVGAIAFSAGQEVIPEQYVNKLRQLLDKIKNYQNIRVHFIGHTDADILSGSAKAKYGDNVGLSRARAEVTAEFFQRVLDLAPESVSYDGVGASQPIARNNTQAGKAQNRRVEVQVWYDEITQTQVKKEIRIAADKLNRIKVCRKEIVCKLRYKKGNAKRARLRNLVSPLRLKVGQADIPEEFIRQTKEVLSNLSSKKNLVLRFVGHTHNLPLSDRQLRIYGNHKALSKARARRVALAMSDALQLSHVVVGSGGKGASRPVASNDSQKGRRLNQRIEVEFWYDDPFQAVSDGLQACPEQAAAETITLSYDPPSGPIKDIQLLKGQPIISPAFTQRLQILMQEISDRTNVRLSFIGYTDNQRLSRRTAMVYGDDIGLSGARAKKVMRQIQKDLALTDKQVEFEGRGFVHSKDVANTGFVKFGGSRVELQILYDELALLEDEEGLDITRIQREASAHSPYALNLMRISVDGEPIHDPYKNSADLQRCADVALEKAQIQFKFDNLKLQPRLNISAWPNSVRYADLAQTQAQENKVLFKIYSNYQDYISKSEVRIFKDQQSIRQQPLAVILVDQEGRAEWLAEFENFQGPTLKLKYLLRVYDDKNNYDETKALPLWVIDQLQTASQDGADTDIEKELLVGYGKSNLARQNIPLEGANITVNGSQIPPGHSVWLAGRPLPVSPDGEFVADEIFRPGLHSIEVAVLDAQGNGDLFLRQIELKKNDWFYVGIADFTLAKDNTSGPARIVTQDLTHYQNELNTDGRLAFYLDGKFANAWHLTASADTREGPINEIFSNFMEKDPAALFRRIDPDYFYPTFGDDSSIVENAPTSGKFYVKLQRLSDYVLWGNFIAEYVDTDLAHIDRGLYGANGHFETQSTTRFGEKIFALDGFAAEPGTIGGRDEFRGTGGSLYFLRHLDLLMGSDRLRIEVRDKDSDIVLSVKNLVPSLDYDIDYIQGRILLNEPLAATARDQMLVNNGSLSGNPVYLVARYEYSPGFQNLEDIAIGGRLHYWLNDYLKLGLTASSQQQQNNESKLSGVDLLLRKSASTWLKFEKAKTQGQGGELLLSNNGGLNFNNLDPALNLTDGAGAYRLDASVLFSDVVDGVRGKSTFYVQQREAGFSAPGQFTQNFIKQYGAKLKLPINKKINLNIKADVKDQLFALKTQSADINMSYSINSKWRLSSGVRLDSREDNSLDVVESQRQGDRTDIALDLAYNSLSNWTAYGFLQGTGNTTGNRQQNSRIGSGATVRLTDRFNVEGEVSTGDLGTGARLGTQYLVSDRTNMYMSYALDNESNNFGLNSRRGNMTMGMRSRYSDSLSVYGEERYTHGDVPTGLTHALGVDIGVKDRWTYGAKVEAGRLEDQKTLAQTQRLAIGLSMGYEFAAIKYTGAIEFREDTVQNTDLSESTLSAWLYKNSLRYQINPDWRFISKLNYSDSQSSIGDIYDGEFKEYILGYGYRPVSNDRWNTLFKYTYFYNVPSSSQLTANNSRVDFLQKTNIIAVDSIFDLNSHWSLGTKYAYRLGQVSLDRNNPEFFDSRASLYVLRADWHFVHRWDSIIEYRLLDLPDAQDRRSGALVGLYRHVGKNIKLGLGYNFTDFSDDLTDQDYNSRGFYINIIAKI